MSRKKWFIVLLLPVFFIHLLATFVSFSICFSWGDAHPNPELMPFGIRALGVVYYGLLLPLTLPVQELLFKNMPVQDWMMYICWILNSILASAISLSLIFFIRKARSKG